MSKKIRVGVLFGGRSPEYEVSLSSATSVLQHLDEEKYEVVPIAIDRAGSWWPGVTPQQIRQGWQPAAGEVAVVLTIGTDSPGLVPVNAQASAAQENKLDVIFPVLHGPYGEDGTLQGLLEMAKIPYVGCGVLASALGISKEKTKLCLRAQDLPVLDALTITRHEWQRNPEPILTQTEQRFCYPCFVKPEAQGSSIGISKATNREQLREAIDLAARYDQKILIEPGLQCREFSCAVLGNREPRASVVGEIIAGNDFSDYNDKYVDQRIQFLIPSPLSTDEAEMLSTYALRAYQALDLNGLARVDFFQDKQTGKFYINEVNTLPGFTAMSLYPKLWSASGLSYPDLLDRLIELGFERYQDRQTNITQHMIIK